MRHSWLVLRFGVIGAAAAIAAGCATPPPPAATVKPPAPVVATPAPPPPAVAVRPPSQMSEAEWRRALAQHIMQVNRDRVFDGRPPHPLKAIVVLELTVAADGRVQRASVLRAPDHARELGAEAVRTAQAASPLPPPPRSVAGQGATRFTETWLFRHDNQFQLRTLAQTQLIQ
jgi:TonB family protein